MRHRQRPGRTTAGCRRAISSFVVSSTSVLRPCPSMPSATFSSRPSDAPGTPPGVAAHVLVGVFRDHELPAVARDHHPPAAGPHLAPVGREQDVEHVVGFVEEALGIAHVLRVAPAAPLTDERADGGGLAGAGLAVPEEQLPAAGGRFELHQLVEPGAHVARVVRADLGPARRVERARRLVRAVVAPAPERDLHRIAQVGLGAAVADDGPRLLDQLPGRTGDGDARTAGVGLHEQRRLAPARRRAHRPAGLDPPVDLGAVGKDLERGDLGVDAELHHPRLVAPHERREREHRHHLRLASGAVDHESLVERPLHQGLGEYGVGLLDVVHWLPFPAAWEVRCRGRPNHRLSGAARATRAGSATRCRTPRAPRPASTRAGSRPTGARRVRGAARRTGCR